MKPLNIDKTGCTNMSSNCVVWQGPDIECINLCKGDSVTEVVYKLALELCKLMDTFDLKNYDLKCFSSGVCQPQNFQDFINILINKVCTLQACNPDCVDSCNPCTTPPVAFSTMQSGGGSGDTYVPIAKEFQFKNAKGDEVTMLPVSDYAQAIGNKVATLVNSTNIVQQTLSNHSMRLAKLEDPANTPTFEMPTVTPVGVLPKVATSMQLVLSATEQQFSEMKTALGGANDIYTNMQKMDTSLNDLKSLSVPGSNLSSLRGFESQPSNLADVIGNVIVMLKDMRTAIINIKDNYIPSDCDSISIDLVATIKNNQLVFYFTGTLPASTFVNSAGLPTVFTITDNHGASVSYSIDIFSAINAPAGYIVDIAETRLVLTDNLTITGNPSFTSKVNGSVCKSYLSYTVVNEAVCPAIIYTASTDNVGYSFTSGNGTQAYTVELLDAVSLAIISSQTLISTSVKTFTGTFSGLTGNTQYKARVKVAMNNQEKVCEFTSVTTL